MPNSAYAPNSLKPGCGESVAAATTPVNVTPVVVTTLMTCGSPATQAYGIVMMAWPRRGSVALGEMVKYQNASSTSTCAMVVSTGPPFSTVTRKPSGTTTMRCTDSSSTGGTDDTKIDAGLVTVKTHTSATSASAGSTIQNHSG